MPDWEADSVQLQKNLRSIAADIQGRAARREAASLETARAWHFQMMDGLEAPDDACVGRYRGETGLETCNVRVGPNRGAPASDVAHALDDFERVLNEALVALDQAIPVGSELSADQLNAVLDLCGWAHAEWVRIHPFVNGNGRTARLWANFVAVRYGVPPFVRLRPRPGALAYAEASASAMQGDWRPSARLMRSLLAGYWSDMADRRN